MCNIEMHGAEIRAVSSGFYNDYFIIFLQIILSITDKIYLYKLIHHSNYLFDLPIM
jgi:hypothetical protein